MQGGIDCIQRVEPSKPRKLLSHFDWSWRSRVTEKSVSEAYFTPDINQPDLSASHLFSSRKRARM